VSLRQTVRSLARQPVHSAAIVLTLALATGATTAIVGVADAALFRPLPYAEPGGLYRLVGIYSGVKQGGAVSFQDWTDVRNGVDVLATTALHTEWSPTLTGVGAPAVETGLLVTADFFDLLGLRPSLGRFLVPKEDVHGNHAVVVLGHGLWQGRFGADSSVIGRAIMVNGTAREVVGVGPADLPDALPGIGTASIYAPLGYASSPNAPSRGNESLRALVRLADGVSTDRADAEVGAVMADIAQSYPDTNTGQSMRVEPFREATVADARPALFVFMGAVIVVLLIAVVNVINLMIARGADRRRELAMRAALGASRARLAGQLVAESSILALAGGLVGWWIAVYGTRFLVSAGAGSIPLTQLIEMDGRVLLVTATVCLIAGTATGLVSGLHASAGDVGRVLLESGGARGSTRGRSMSRLRRSLVAAQVALCVLLVIGASLLVRSLDRLVRVDPGFDTQVISVRLAPSAGDYPDDSHIEAYFDAVVERIGVLPGVLTVAMTSSTPLSGDNACGTLYAEEDPDRFVGQDMCAEVRPVSPGYFEVMGIPVVAGRTFTAAHDSTSPYVGIISRTTADLLWPGQDPIGRRFNTGLGVYHEVVAVVDDVKQFSLDEVSPPQTYLPGQQWNVRGRAVILRAGVAPESLYPALRDAIWSVDDRVAIRGMGVLADDVDVTTRSPRFRTMLVASFAGLALLLALVGLYGVIAGSVSSRRPELAIRLSLGARPPGLLRLVLAEGGRIAVLGIAAGLVGAFALGRLLESLLFGVSATDPVAFVAAPVLVLACALLANLLPALRATRVDPAETLRMQ
jgi:putative ABC transport system permease protein